MSSERAEWLTRVLGVRAAATMGAAPAALEHPPLLPIWIAAKENAGEQISAIQKAMLESGRPFLKKVADYGLNGLTRNLQVSLHVELLQYDRASGMEKAARSRAVTKAVLNFSTFVRSDPLVKLLDTNPLGVKSTIRETFIKAVEDIMYAIELH